MPFIIADIGSNHRGSLDIARAQIKAAKDCGADAAKFQLFTHQELYGYPGDDTWAMPREWVPELARYSREVGIEFMCTAFSPEGYDFVNEYVCRHKIASSEFTHVGIWERVNGYGKPIIASTGAAHHNEIHLFLFYDWSGWDVTLLECIGVYPADPSDYNFSWLTGITPIKWGISDHTNKWGMALVAVGAGATMFEVHFDSEIETEALWTPDTPVSLSPKCMKSYVGNIKGAMNCMVVRPKRPCRAEDDMVLKHKRRLKVTQTIKKGDTLQLGVNFGIYRSKDNDSHALAPMFGTEIHTKRATKDLAIGDGVGPGDFE